LLVGDTYESTGNSIDCSLSPSAWASTDVRRQGVRASGILYLTSRCISLSIANAVKVASGLRVCMAGEDVGNYMEHHGMGQTNVYSISLDRGRTLTYSYSLGGGTPHSCSKCTVRKHHPQVCTDGVLQSLIEPTFRVRVPTSLRSYRPKAPN
jgi:hypothetical protein